ncbi:ArsR family transcriptional regulator [Natrinema pallidum DSM 3751]|uniref:ArsR family transcriptional regulator n=2 Tax=Natrinema pallidum TaxID=69527 RepID=L9YGI9_9EURY|nr:ArsR family transcriptional regulator [Natrinema pallidum DSM 3751]
MMTRRTALRSILRASIVAVLLATTLTAGATATVGLETGKALNRMDDIRSPLAIQDTPDVSDPSDASDPPDSTDSPDESDTSDSADASDSPDSADSPDESDPSDASDSPDSTDSLDGSDNSDDTSNGDGLRGSDDSNTAGGSNVSDDASDLNNTTDLPSDSSGTDPAFGERSDPVTTVTGPSETNADEGDESTPETSPSRGDAARTALATLLTATAVNASAVGRTPLVVGRSSLGGTARLARLSLERASTDDWWRYLGSLFRYSRFDDSDPLAHESRAEIYRVVGDDPGISLSELAAATDASLSTVRHHLRILEEETLLRSEKVQGKRCYYRTDATDEVDIALRTALEKPATRRILEVLAERGPAQTTTLADELDRDPSTISHHLTSLADAGLVVRDREGPAVINRLASDVELPSE